MASQLTPTTLGGLEFNDIKNSLTNYLRSQSLFDGYNFEGSALQTMIDLMELGGYGVHADINKEYKRLNLQPKPPLTSSYQVTADTAYEALRKAFNYWTKHNA